MSLSRTMTIAKTLEKIKAASSKWMKEDRQNIKDFKWQKGYGIFSLGESQLPNLLRYIKNQKEHHKEKTYEEELKHICNMYQIDSNNLN